MNFLLLQIKYYWEGFHNDWTAADFLAHLIAISDHGNELNGACCQDETPF